MPKAGVPSALDSRDYQIFALFGFAFVQFMVGFALAAPSSDKMGFMVKFLTKMLNDPFQIGLLLGIFGVSLTCLESTKVRWGAIAIAVLAETWRIYAHWTPAFIGLVAGLGSLSAALGSLSLILTAATQSKQRLRTLSAFCHALTLPMLYLGSSFLMQRYIYTAPVYDMFYYAADRQLGPSWGFTFSALAKTQFWFYTVGFLAYFSLSQAMALTTSWWFKSRRGPNPNLLFIACALAGNVGYTLFPAVGPQSFFQQLFPFSPPSPLPPHLMDFPLADPRTAMPSLHVLWSYAIWVGSFTFSAPLRKLAFLYFLSMPVVAFLGPHYTVDIIVALGLGPGLHWICLRPFRRRSAIHMDIGCALTALASFGYVGLLLWGYPVWSVWPWILQGSSLAILIASVYFSWLLHQISMEAYRN